MAMGGGIMDFVQRFRTLQLQRHSSEELIQVHSFQSPSKCRRQSNASLFPPQDLLVYTEGVESKLRTENQNLISQLHDAELDLAAATKSRRELQQQLHMAETQSTILLQENAHLKV